MERLLDFSQPFDVRLFEQVIRVFLNANDPNHVAAHNVVVALRESPQAWQHVDKILAESTDPQARFMALQILEDAVRFRWKALPPEQRLGIRNYVTDKLISLSRDGETLEREKLFVQRLNLVLVAILKQEWPHNMPTFIPDLVGAAKTSESLCENNMAILKLLSEEIFDFSKEEMTSAKTKIMRESLNDQFQLVFSLCDLVLDRGTKPRLLTTTLRTLLRFLSWIPVGFIFQTPLIDRLLNKFFPVQIFRNDALACLTEIASLRMNTNTGQDSVAVVAFDETFVRLHNGLVMKLEGGMLPAQVDVAALFDRVKEEDREFIQHLALFFSGFYSAHLHLLERPENHEFLMKGMMCLVRISHVDNPEVFKICLDTWNRLAADLYRTECAMNNASLALIGAPGGGGLNLGNTNGTNPDENDDVIVGEDDADARDEDDDDYNGEVGGGGGDDGAGNRFMASGVASSSTSTSSSSRILIRPPPSWQAVRMSTSPRRMLYAPICTNLRHLIISRMPRPEEVLVAQDESGEVVRETTKDTDAIALYKQMRDSLIYLTHLDVEDTERIMITKLSEQCEANSEEDYSPRAINSLSWAIGSISGTMDEATEKHFLVAVIKDLLLLCEMKNGKDNKALIASDIMYVVGQYPKFLRMHWKFLKTVVIKLFEFMHELHPGVQDMACDTFLKLAIKCRRKFIQLEPGETQPYINLLLSEYLIPTTSDLQPHQVHAFYEAVGVILECHPDPNVRADYLAKLMEAPNQAFFQITQEAQANVDSLLQLTRVKEVAKIMRTNVHVARATKHTFISQLGRIYLDSLNVYKKYSSAIASSLALHGPQVLTLPNQKAMRLCKIEILAVVRTFIERSEDPRLVAEQIVTCLYDPVLEDYAVSPALARDAEVLELFTAVVSRLKKFASACVPYVVASTFASTLAMIATNFEDFPEHRAHFYRLLRAMTTHCFPTLWSAEEARKQLVDAVVWGFKHTERDVADCALETLETMLRFVAQLPPQEAQLFYSRHLLNLIQDVLYVLTDRLHKSGFRLHATLLRDMFALVEQGHVRVALFPNNPVYASDPNVAGVNSQLLRQHIIELIAGAFPNVGRPAVGTFVQGLFDSRAMDLPAFKQHVRDFLIQLKEFSADTNNDLLFAEERSLENAQQRRAALEQRMAVPGLISSSERDEMADL